MKEPKWLPPMWKHTFLPDGWTRLKSQKILPLPKGWRWLRKGEYPLEGDFMHDPRGYPVRQVCDAEFPLTDTHHPVRTPIKLRRRKSARQFRP